MTIGLVGPYGTTINTSPRLGLSAFFVFSMSCSSAVTWYQSQNPTVLTNPTLLVPHCQVSCCHWPVSPPVWCRPSSSAATSLTPPLSGVTPCPAPSSVQCYLCPALPSSSTTTSPMAPLSSAATSPAVATSSEPPVFYRISD